MEKMVLETIVNERDRLISLACKFPIFLLVDNTGDTQAK
jgi:hypothetical protein